MSRKKISTSNDGGRMMDVEVQESVIMPESVTSLEGVETTTTPAKESVKTEGDTKLYTKEEVRNIIADFMKEKESEKTNNSLIRKKKVEKHLKTVFRFNGKWVVDFVDRNKDEYEKRKIHAYNKINPLTSKEEPHIELKFDDDSTLEIPLYTYIRHRIPVLCPIDKREKVDVSYENGTTERKVVVKDGYQKVTTGEAVPLEIEVYKEFMHMELPDGRIIKIPDHALA